MVYGELIRESIQNKTVDVNEMLIALGEASLLLEEYEDSEDLITEGTNIDSLKVFRSNKKEFKPHLKALKKAIKAEDKTAAKAEAKACNSILSKMETDIRNIPDQTSSAVLGLFLNGFLDLFRGGLVSIATLIAGVGFGVNSAGSFKAIADAIIDGKINTGAIAATKLGNLAYLGGSITAYIGAIVSNIKTIVKMINEVKKKDGDVEVKDLNMWKSKLLTFVDDYKKQINKLANSVK